LKEEAVSLTPEATVYAHELCKTAVSEILLK